MTAIFNANRYGEPVQRHWTKNMTVEGVGIKDILSCLSTNAGGALTFGIFNRGVGLYSNEGKGLPITFFPVSGNHVDKSDGGGVTNVECSPCSTYTQPGHEQLSLRPKAVPHRDTRQLLEFNANPPNSILHRQLTRYSLFPYQKDHNSLSAAASPRVGSALVACSPTRKVRVL
ncbi:uncharacterized protein BDZ99DRAFT_525805 [Mytilinidion resinicola]|uniref:Uncharacterized protein n=1 Tax=Mytilinidion resinicola TaxID=574789 RepID=A0A6A6Y6R4_9PEZI|nr:uncharacterized protein BDZ99DRAFT_525805 [Mytilinidion resinicola]KAF2804213.1 hypothetical protein BDZ99DRAFT_525805 [Mytilinidion resinicola]